MSTPFTEEQVQRYARHIILPNIGGAGQRKLLDARVLCIGAGGLGSPIAMYLAAAGIGKLGIVDFDRVDVSNLLLQAVGACWRIQLPDPSPFDGKGLVPDDVFQNVSEKLLVGARLFFRELLDCSIELMLIHDF